MFKKSSLQRMALIAGACLLAGSVFGCSDDTGTNQNPPDARPGVVIDASAVDAAAADGGGPDAAAADGGAPDATPVPPDATVPDATPVPPDAAL